MYTRWFSVKCCSLKATFEDGALGKGWISIWSEEVCVWGNATSCVGRPGRWPYLWHGPVSTQVLTFAAAASSSLASADFFARHPWLILEKQGGGGGIVLETQPEIMTTLQPPLSGCETAQRYLHEINENLSHVRPCHGQRFTVADACSIWPCSPRFLAAQIHHHGLFLIMDGICQKSFKWIF